MITINNTYPIFEADQVLSQKHLNKLINYLEEQDRVSRTNLLGMGIVAGLKILKPNKTTIKITCGTAITSLGYLISLKDTKYTHYKETTISEAFLHPSIGDQEYLNDIYKYTKKYDAFKNCFELLTDTSKDHDKKSITKTFLEDKIIMLLLEVSLIDKKNCTPTDCADKGKKLDFKIRPLLVDKKLIDAKIFSLDLCTTNYFNTIPIPKYNIPHTNLVTGNQVLEQFSNLIASLKQKIYDELKIVYKYYKNEFINLPNFNSLLNVKNRIDAILSQNNSIYNQYIWDWVCDIVATHDEIVRFNTCNPTISCPDKSKYPFHVLLGSSQFTTSEIEADNDFQEYRTRFLRTGVFVEDQKIKKLELKSLLEKIIHQINHFSFNTNVAQKMGVKITPSVFGKYPLSQKSIPFYYSNIPTLNKKWSFNESFNNKNKEILSYHATTYNTADFVINPLKYDNETFNFFRIEGHLGKNYIDVIKSLKTQQKQYNLPFNIVAINAVDDTNREIAFNNENGDWDDLEIEYDLAKTKLINTTEFIFNWIKNNKQAIFKAYPFFDDSFLNTLDNTLKEFKKLLTDKVSDFIENYTVFYLAFEQLNTIFISHNTCIDNLFQKYGDSNQALLQEIENRLEDFQNIVLEDSFSIIYQEAKRRWIKGVRSTFLSEFSKKHPSISPKTGVTHGGTLALVYIDYSVFVKKTTPLKDDYLFFDYASTYLKLFKHSKAIKKSIYGKNILTSKKAKVLDTKKVVSFENSNPCDESKKLSTDDKNANLAIMLAENFDKSTARYLGKQLQAYFPVYWGGNQTKDTLKQRIIIADFFLPYICCSNGDNINIQLPAQETEPKIADFKSTDFNDDDFYTNKK